MKIPIEYQYFVETTNDLTKFSVLKSLSNISSNLLHLLADCRAKEETWIRRRNIAIVRVAIVSWFKKPKSERLKSEITHFELVFNNNRFCRHLTRFL